MTNNKQKGLTALFANTLGVSVKNWINGCLAGSNGNGYLYKTD